MDRAREGPWSELGFGSWSGIGNAIVSGMEGL